MDEKNRFAHNFSHPFQFSCVVDYKTFEQGSMPMFLLEVVSIDWWDCNRIEGYGISQLPMTSGVSNLDVATWRPKGNL